MKLHTVLLLIAVAGCKTASDSKLQSLDNLSRTGDAALNLNVCSGTYGKDFNLYWGEGATEKDRIQVDSPLKDQLKPAIQKSLSAVPDGLQDWFFDKGGRMIISGNASTLCKTEASRKGDITETADAYHSCWKMEAGKFPVIYINADPDLSRKIFTGAGSDLEVLTQEMQHSIVRSFGYVFSEVLTRLTPKQGKTDEFEYAEGDKEVQDDKELMAWKFIDDIRGQVKAGKNPDEYLAFKDLIQNPDILDPKKLSYEEAWRVWFKQYKTYEASTKKETPKTDEWSEKARIFQDKIYAEAFDSWYCNVETRAQLTDKKSFNSSGAFFAKNIISELEDAFAQRTKSAAAESGDKTVAADTDTAEESTKTLNPADTAVTSTEVSSDMNNSYMELTGPAPSPNDEGTAGLSLTGWRYPILRGLFAIGSALTYPVRAVAAWSVEAGTARYGQAEGSLIRGQPVRNTMRVINGGPLGWRVERWHQTGGFQPFQRLERGCLIRRWRC